MLSQEAVVEGKVWYLKWLDTNRVVTSGTQVFRIFKALLGIFTKLLSHEIFSGIYQICVKATGSLRILVEEFYLMIRVL